MKQYNENTLKALQYIEEKEYEFKKNEQIKNNTIDQIKMFGGLTANLSEEGSLRSQRDSLRIILDSINNFVASNHIAVKTIHSIYYEKNDLDIRAVKAIYDFIHMINENSVIQINIDVDFFGLHFDGLHDGTITLPEEERNIEKLWHEKLYSFENVNDYISKYDGIVKQEKAEKKKAESEKNSEKVESVKNQVYEHILAHRFLKSRIVKSLYVSAFINPKGYPVILEGERKFKLNSSDYPNTVGLAATNNALILLNANGTVKYVYENGKKDLYDHIDEVNGWKDIIQISAGTHHVVGLKKDGTLVATHIKDNVAYKNNGQCDVNELKDIIYVCCGEANTMALSFDNKIVTVGKPKSSHGGVLDIDTDYLNSNYTLIIEDGTLVDNYQLQWALEKNDCMKNRPKNIAGVCSVGSNTAYQVDVNLDGTVNANDFEYNYVDSLKEINDAILAKKLGNYIGIFHKDGTISLNSFEGFKKDPIIKLFDDYEKEINTHLQIEKDHIERLKNAKQESLNKLNQMESFRKQGLCQYCGGTFKKTLFSLKCMECGKAKDY